MSREEKKVCKNCEYCCEGICNGKHIYSCRTIEVIGNIHDNPELLEK